MSRLFATAQQQQLKTKQRKSTSWRRILPASARRLLGHLARTIGLRAGGTRKVRFHASTSVFEFERQLLGGGGVPDGDTVALGLGPKCALSYFSRSPSSHSSSAGNSKHVSPAGVLTHPSCRSPTRMTRMSMVCLLASVTAASWSLLLLSSRLPALPPLTSAPLCFSVHRLSGR